MSPAALFAPAGVLLSASTTPFLMVAVARAVFERTDQDADGDDRSPGQDLGTRWCAAVAVLGLAGIHALGGVRLIGPSLVPTFAAPGAIAFGALAGSLCAAIGWRAMRPLPPFGALGEGAVGAAAGATAVIVVGLGLGVVWSRSDVATRDTARHPLNDELRTAHLRRIERRAWMNPWDPDVYLARAWNSHHDRHDERALRDADLAERLGADPIPVAALRADALAALERCDEGRLAYERWQRLRAARAMTERFGDELESLVMDEEDPFQPSEYLFDCDTADYFGE